MMIHIILSGYLLVLSIFDIRERRIPTFLPIIGCAIGMGFGMAEIFATDMEVWEGVIGCVGGMLPGSILLAVAFFTKKAGYGDGLVLLSIGLACGYLRTMSFLCISLAIMSPVSIILLVAKKAGKNTTLPYIPFLTMAYIGCVGLGVG